MKLDEIIAPLMVVFLLVCGIPIILSRHTPSDDEDLMCLPEDGLTPLPSKTAEVEVEVEKEPEPPKVKSRYQKAHDKCVATCRRHNLEPLQCDTKIWRCWNSHKKDVVILWESP